MSETQDFVTVEIIETFLKCNIYFHTCESSKSSSRSFNCWTFITVGLWKKKQKELVLTIKAEEGETKEDYPKGPLQLFCSVFTYAANNTIVEEGDTTEFDASGFIGNTEIRGVMYVPAQPIKGVLFPSDPHMSVITVHEYELEVAKNYGVTRVLCMIGHQYNYFPFPPWNEIKRASALLSKDIVHSTSLAKSARLRLNLAVASVENNMVTLRIPGVCLNPFLDLIKKTSEKASITLLLGLDDTADGHLVWTPNSKSLKPITITPVGSTGKRLAGSFVTFVPGQKVDRVMIYEDGFFVMLTDPSWYAFRQYLPTKKGMKVQSDVKGLDFEIFWHEIQYVNPLDGSVYGTNKGWYPQTSTDSVGSEENKSISLVDVLLLTDEKEVKQNISPEVLSKYITGTASIIETTLIAKEWTKDCKLTVQVTFGPAKKLSVEFQTDPPKQLEEAEITSLLNHISIVPMPTVKRSDIKFLLSFLCKR
eukprot:TRINITY_DN13667_c0_g1_i1.p1 TRINITY_DN13667_c0_g1~~TRINITY_DN13667_c0_g1_i1.p1  ORF type:complete len:477 (-),score=96.69 TRINITY_DN13667_c0_g1_i1:25-1455(-)